MPKGNDKDTKRPAWKNAPERAAYPKAKDAAKQDKFYTTKRP